MVVDIMVYIYISIVIGVDMGLVPEKSQRNVCKLRSV